MKKFFALAICALLLLPLATSCGGGGPKGDPKKDAETFKKLYKEKEKVELEIEEKKLEMRKYYSEKKNYSEYEEFESQLNHVRNDVKTKFEQDNRDKIDKIRQETKEADNRFRNNSKQ